MTFAIRTANAVKESKLNEIDHCKCNVHVQINVEKNVNVGRFQLKSLEVYWSGVCPAVQLFLSVMMVMMIMMMSITKFYK